MKPSHERSVFRWPGNGRSFAIGAVLAATVLVSACAAPRAPIRFDPAAGLPSAADSVPAFASAPRPRAQHSEGSAGENLFPCPAPDGKSIYYASDRQGTRFRIFRKAPGASPVTAVSDGPGNDLHPAVSPDARRLAFSSDREGAWSLYILDLDAKAPPRRLTGPGEDSFGPSWSPDSRRIAFFRHGVRTGGWEVWTVDVESGAEEYLVPGMFPAWSPAGPDGDWISFQDARGPDGWYAIWKVRADGRHPTQLVAGETWGAVHPSWSPDGRWIAFCAVGKGAGGTGAPGAGGGRPAAGDIYLIGSDGARLVNLTADRSAVSEWNPAFGPDGRIYFNSDEEGGANIWSLDPGVGKAPPALPVTPEPPPPMPALSRASEPSPAVPTAPPSPPAATGGLGAPSGE